mgnify:CR=1 FL=1
MKFNPSSGSSDAPACLGISLSSSIPLKLFIINKRAVVLAGYSFLPIVKASSRCLLSFLCLREFAPLSMKAAFMAIEDHELGANAHRGAGGPVHVSVGKLRYPVADAMIADVARDIPAGQHWRSTMHQIANEFRTAFKAHRDGARVYAGTFLATENVLTRERTPLPTPAEVNLGFKRQNIDTVLRAMHGVTVEGTSTRVFAGAGYLSGGKTGTAQAVTIGQKDRYDARKLEEHQRDHSLYVAFAPVDKPRVALALVVENAGFGAAHAAPIARRVFDYLLLDQYPSAQDLAAVRVGQASAPIGTPRKASEMPWPPEAATSAP